MQVERYGNQETCFLEVLQLIECYYVTYINPKI